MAYPAHEVLSHLIICKEMKYIKEPDYEEIRNRIEELSFLLTNI